MPKLLACPACGGKVSEAAHSCPHCGHPSTAHQKRPAKVKKKRGFFSKLYTMLALVLFVGFLALILLEELGGPHSNVAPVDIADSKPVAEELESTPDVNYEVLGRTVSDTRLKTMVSVRLLVPKENLNERALRRTVLAAFQEVRSETGFDHRDQADQVFIYAFASKAHAKQAGTNWVAMLDWRAWGEDEPNVTVDKARLASLNAPGNTRFGLTTAQRQKVFKESFVATRKAREVADRRYPSPDDWQKYGEEKARQQARLDAEIEKAFGITSDQREAIIGEGFKHRWPQ